MLEWAVEELQLYHAQAVTYQETLFNFQIHQLQLYHAQAVTAEDGLVARGAFGGCNFTMLKR